MNAHLVRWVMASLVGLAFLISTGTVSAQSAAPEKVATADEENQTQTEPPSETQTEATLTLESLPSMLPSGQPLYPIGLFESQMVELVPGTFRAVSISQLSEAIRQLTNRATDDQASRLRGAEYWIKWDDGVLTSDRSVIDIESDRDAVVRRSLGRVNLALLAPPLSGLGLRTAADRLPRLESDTEGDLVAVFRGGQARRTRIEFQWQLQGRTYGSGQEFTLRLPRTPQTRIVMSMPADIEVEAIDGVLRARPDPPPDTSEWLIDRDRRWYEIDAGGLASVRIRTQPSEASTPTEALVVRRSSIQYDIDASGLNWIHRMVVQLPTNRPFPSLRVIGGNITSVKVNGIEAAFTTKPIDSGGVSSGRDDATSKKLSVEQVQIDLPIGAITGGNSDTLTVMGQSIWRGDCELPMAIFAGDGVVYASATDEVQLSIAPPLDLVSWELPESWNQTANQSVDGVRLCTASGPPLGNLADGGLVLNEPQVDRDTDSADESQAAAPEIAPELASSLGKTIHDLVWSRVRLIETSMLRRSETAVRLDIGRGGVQAKARIELVVDPSRLEPIRLMVQPGWNVDEVSFVPSGRLIESPGIDDLSLAGEIEDRDAAEASGSSPETRTRQTMVLWPEPEDIQRDAQTGVARLILEATGTRVLPGDGPVISVPPSWFARVADVRGDFIAALVPPEDLNWSGEAALQRNRVRLTDLSPSGQKFFAGLGDKTLYFVPATGRSPEIRLETPGVSFDVTTVLEVTREGDEIVERLTINVESAGQNLKELVVQTGGQEDASAGSELAPQATYFWALGAGNDAPSTSLPTSDVLVGSDASLDAGDQPGTYRIDVSELNLRGRPLVARRRYNADASFRLPLPGVPGAASQRSEVWLGQGLLVGRKSDAVQLVPLVESDREPSELSESSRPETDRNQNQRLRYDAVEQPSIEVMKSDVRGNVTILWGESVRVVASSRGTDRIEAFYRVSPTAPLVIDYEPDMQLASIHRDGEPIDLSTIPRRPIRLQPRQQTETISVVWNRNRFDSSWFRQCRVPKIDVDAVVMQSAWELTAASDAFAPAGLLSSSTAGPSKLALSSNPSSIDQASIRQSSAWSRSIMVRRGDQVWLVRRNVVLGFGWLIAMVVFAGGWMLASRLPMMTAAILIILTAFLFLWWDWNLAVIGWLIMPITAGATLAMSQAWTTRGSNLSNAPESLWRSRDPSDDDAGESGDVSWNSLTRTLGSGLWWIGWVVVGVVLAVQASAQERPIETPSRSNSPNEKTAAKSVPLLVPVDAKGQLSGDIVYVPRSVHGTLFPNESVAKIQEPRFESANYRVKLTPPAATIEAEYVIHLVDGNRGTNQVRFPIKNTSVRRVELIDGIEGTVRFAADEAGDMVVTLPNGDRFELRITLLPSISRPEPWTKLFLSIPKVASSSLTVESDQSIEALRVGGPRGRLLAETDLRRWVTPLGAIDSLEIDYRAASTSSTDAARPLGRRYWINAGKQRVTIECEVDPPTAAAAGEAFQFVIRDAEMPLVTSGNWRLVGSELYSPTRRLVSMTSLRDAPGPIRLLWSRPRARELKESVDSEVLEIPEVIAAALGDNAPAWIAYHSDPALRFDPPPPGVAEPLSVDQYMAAWSGYRGRIDRAIVTSTSIPVMRLRPAATTPTTMTRRHHLHVMADRLEVQFGAVITPGADASVNRRLLVPSEMELLELSIDGVALETLPLSIGDSHEYVLGSFTDTEPVSVKAIATLPLASNRRFTPPLMSLDPSEISSDVYSMSRDASTSLQVKRPVTLEPLGPEPKATAESLAQGWIPVSTWLVGLDKASKMDGVFEVRARKTRFNSSQLVELVRQDGRWKMQTSIQFDNGRVPDFVDVELPTRWCDSLEVTPTTSWSRQPGTDPTSQVIRIRCDGDELAGQDLSVMGFLQSADAGRVGVPNVRVLGFGNRQVHISVPNRLTNEPIQWRTSAVEAVELPDRWMNRNGPPRMADPLDDRDSADDRSIYLAASSAWSIDLAPLPTLSSDALATGQDNLLFRQSDRVLVIAHWDLFPGGAESVKVRLPPGATCLGGWSAGQSAVLRLIDDRVVEIPLALSRLTQSVEVLIDVPSESARRRDFVPELINIPVTQNWLSVYEPGQSATQLVGDDNMGGQQRAVSMARSVVESVEQAIDIIAERPSDEVASWLNPWVARYRQLAGSVGYQPNFQIQPAAEDTTDPLPSDEPDRDDAQPVRPTTKQARLDQWQLLDARLAVYVNRFLGDVEGGMTPMFSVADFDGFQAVKVVQLSAIDGAPVVQPELTGDGSLRNLITNALTLILVVGLLVCLRPLRRFAFPIVTHPAFWLGLVGLFGFAVAPAPVAAAVILVAVSMPIMPRGGPSKQSS